MQKVLRYYFSINPLKNAIRFEAENRNWDHNELNTHSDAFAYGLVELGWKKQDKLGVWCQKSSVSEVVAAQFAALKCGFQTVTFDSNNSSQFKKDVSDNQVKGVLFNPDFFNSQTKQKYVDIVQETLPELDTVKQGELFKSSNYPHLQHLIQTGRNNQRGMYKYRQILHYNSQNFEHLALPKQDKNANILNNFTYQQLIDFNKQVNQQHGIDKSTSVFVMGDPKNAISTAFGLINCIENACFVVSTIGKLYKNVFLLVDSDLITEDSYGVDLSSFKSVAVNNSKQNKLDIETVKSLHEKEITVYDNSSI